MTPKFKNGTIVRFTPEVVAAAPAYAGKKYVISAASAAWGIGETNVWYGDYVIEAADGTKSVTRESCLEAV